MPLDMGFGTTTYGWLTLGPGPSGQSPAAAPTVNVAPQPTPVTPTIDPKIEANALYGKPMALFVGGFARIGASPAPIIGPYLNSGQVDFAVSFGVPANVDGDRKIYAIYLDNELAWSAPAGGTSHADGTFTAESFLFLFRPGTLTQAVLGLETTHFPGDENAYRPQMVLEIRGLPYARFMANTGKPVPYVACDIGDVTDGADPLDGINLGEALERVAFSPWVGYTSSTFEEVDITDVVDAVLIKDNFTIVQLCQSITREYRNLDLVLSDKIYIKDRAANVAPDFIFDRDSILAEPRLSVSRTGATAQRREHELNAIDPDQDYTIVPSLSKIPRNPVVISAAVGKDSTSIPLVIDADTRQALATFSQNYEENARRKVSFSVGPYGYEIEPGDLFALSDIADGFTDEVFKCTQTSHNANWTVDIEGEAILRCRISLTNPAPNYINHYENGATSAAQSFNITFPATDVDTLMVIGGGGVTNNRTVSSVTIDWGDGAESMSIDVQSLAAGVGGGFHDVTMFIASLVVPAGETSATVVVTYSGLLDGSYIDVFRPDNIFETTPYDTAAASATGASNPSDTINVPSAGVLIAFFGASDTSAPGSASNFGTTTWTGVGTKQSDEEVSTASAVFWGSAASESGLSAEAGRTVSATNVVGGRKSIIAAVWS